MQNLQEENNFNKKLTIKLYVFLLIVFLLFLISCSKEDSTENLNVVKPCPKDSPDWCMPYHVIHNELRIVQVDPKEIGDFCTNGRACYKESLHSIVLMKMRYPEDQEFFRDLGEEVWHASGGDH